VPEEAHFSWDKVEVGDDDRTLVLRSIHSPMVWSDDDAWFNGGRADVSYEDEAVGVLLWLRECRRGDTGAAKADDPAREVRIELEEPLGGRIPYDGAYKLVTPQGRGKHPSDPMPWTKVQAWGESTLVVYWHGAALYPLDRVDVKLTGAKAVITVFEQPAGRLAGGSKCAVVCLDEQLGDRQIRDGAPPE
jgi:hypothetical protein